MNNVEFYDKQVKFQKDLRKLQERRATLEQEYYHLTKTDKKLQSVHATKLRSYWKQVCERERRARERNEALLRDFSEFEHRCSKLEAETANLEKLKRKCEDELTKVYPGWRFGIDLNKAKQQLEDDETRVQASPLHAPMPASVMTTPPRSSMINQIDVPLFKLVPFNFEHTGMSPRVATRPFNFDQNIPVPQTTSYPISQASRMKDVRSLEPESFTSTARAEEFYKPRVAFDDGPSYMARVTTPTSQDESVQPMLPFASTAHAQSLPTKSSVQSPKEKRASHSPAQDQPDTHFSSRIEHPPAPSHFPAQIAKADQPDMTSSSRIEHAPTVHPATEPHTVDEPAVMKKATDEARPLAFDSSESSVAIDSLSLISNAERGHESLEQEDVLEDEEQPRLRNVAPQINTPSPIKIPSAHVEFSHTGSESAASLVGSLKENHATVVSESESSTFGTPRQPIPLTDNPAYQSMLRSGGMSKGRRDSNDSDDLEAMVSPKSKAHGTLDDFVADSHSVVSNSHEEAEKSSSVSSVPKKTTQYPSRLLTKKAKAPWDTESEDDDSFMMTKPKKPSSDDDDFDFFD